MRMRRTAGPTRIPIACWRISLRLRDRNGDRSAPGFQSVSAPESRYIKGTIPVSQGSVSSKLCLPTPFDFNNLRFVVALSRQRSVRPNFDLLSATRKPAFASDSAIIRVRPVRRKSQYGAALVSPGI
jgi:hypothetical protein